MSAISVDPPLDSSLGLDLRRGLDPLQMTEGGLSLSEREFDLRQREAELKRLMRTFLRTVGKRPRGNPLRDLKLAADELELQKGKLESQLESQLARQEAWDHCEDDALKTANLEERELILKDEIAKMYANELALVDQGVRNGGVAESHRGGKTSFEETRGHYQTMVAKAWS